MFVYAALVGPLAEEIVFRGAVLRYLEKYGKVYAIVISALLFGVFHSNLTQGVFAFLVGLVLGYVALQYSFKWAVVLHVMNNLVFSDLLGCLMELLDPALSDLILYAMYIVFFVGGVFVLYTERHKIKDYLHRHRTGKKIYFHTLTAFWMVVFIGINVLLALTAITPLAT